MDGTLKLPREFWSFCPKAKESVPAHALTCSTSEIFGSIQKRAMGQAWLVIYQNLPRQQNHPGARKKSNSGFHSIMATQKTGGMPS